MKKLTIAALAMVAFGAADLNAQSQTATATVTVPTVLAITVDNVSIGFTPAAADFTAGSVAGDLASTIDTRGNVAHDLTIQANDPSFTYTGSASPAPTKAASDLEWSIDGGNSFTAISNASAQDVATALSRGVNANAAIVDYQVLLSLGNDAPGSYELDFTYTLVAN